MALNYDPNRNFDDKHTVSLVFQQWKYSTTVTVEMTNNLRGYDLIDHAIDSIIEDLPVKSYMNDDLSTYDISFILLEDGENQLIVEDDKNRGDLWLKSMLVSFNVDKLEIPDGSQR